MALSHDSEVFRSMIFSAEYPLSSRLTRTVTIRDDDLSEI